MFITQKQFFEKLDKNKYSGFENKLCWLVDIFIILSDFWVKISETEIMQKALEMNVYDENLGWKYDWLIKIFNFYYNSLLIENSSSLNNKNLKIKIFDTKFFHNKKLEKIFYNFENKIFLASIVLDENHLIIIEKVEYNNIYYKSVWTKKFEAKENWIIKMNDFFKVYNKRGILIEKNFL